jgi:glycosyltransferase involved in cell wall biosynthesis
MRIGVDGSCWANDRGYGRYARELLGRLAHLAVDDELVFFLDPESRSRFDLAAPNVRLVEVRQSEAPTTAASADGSRSVRDMLRFTRAVWSESPDVFFCPSVYTYFPLPPRQKALIAIHDAIAERFPSRTLPSRRARLFWTAKVRLAVLQSTLVLSVSDFAADDVSRVIGVPRSRIRVALEAPAEAFRPSASRSEIEGAARAVGLPDGAEWITYVGGFSPHKNLDVLVRSFARVLAREAETGRPPTYLLLVGKLTGDVFHLCVDEVRETALRLGIEDRVLWPGFVPDEQLRHLHSGAVALALPSDCEGFGLPAVEAAACGTPVVATTESPLPALLEGGGIFVAPRDEDGLTEALTTMLDEAGARCRMAKRALASARLLSWDRCAEQALAALRETARS